MDKPFQSYDDFSDPATCAPRLAALRVRPGQKPPVGVFYQVWDRPLMTVGGTHWISDALALCGARNVFADLQALSGALERIRLIRGIRNSETSIHLSTYRA